MQQMESTRAAVLGGAVTGGSGDRDAGARQAQPARRTRRWALGGAALAGGVVLAACGEAPAQGGPKAVAGPKQLSLAAFFDFTSPAAVKTREAFAEQFPGVEFQTETTPWGEYINKQIVLMASGSAPDVVASENEQFPAFAKGNLYKPLAPFFNKDKSVATKDFYPQLVAGYSHRGEQYCIPGDLAPIPAIFANRRLFEAAGLEIPSEKDSFNYTWDRVAELAKKLTRPDGSQYGLHVEYFQSVPYSGGAYYVDDRNNPRKGTLDDPRWARSIEMLVDWTNRQKIMPTAADRDRLGQKDWWGLFAQGKVAMYLTGPWQIRRFLEAEPGLQWDMFWVPKLANNLPRKFRTGGTGWGMSQNVRNPDLAWEWLKFSNGRPGYEIGQKYVPETVVRLFAHVPSSELEVARLKKLGMANVDIFLKGAPDVLWWPFHPEWPRINSQVLGPDMGKLLRGEEAPGALLKDMNERLTRELQADP